MLALTTLHCAMSTVRRQQAKLAYGVLNSKIGAVTGDSHRYTKSGADSKLLRCMLFHVLMDFWRMI